MLAQFSKLKKVFWILDCVVLVWYTHRLGAGTGRGLRGFSQLRPPLGVRAQPSPRRHRCFSIVILAQKSPSSRRQIAWFNTSTHEILLPATRANGATRSPLPLTSESCLSALCTENRRPPEGAKARGGRSRRAVDNATPTLRQFLPSSAPLLALPRLACLFCLPLNGFTFPD